MDIEEKQAEVIDHFVKQASVLKGPALVHLIVEATSNPSLFAFSEILSVPNVVEVLLVCLLLISLFLSIMPFSLDDSGELK